MATYYYNGDYYYGGRRNRISNPRNMTYDKGRQIYGPNVPEIPGPLTLVTSAFSVVRGIVIFILALLQALILLVTLLISSARFWLGFAILGGAGFLFVQNYPQILPALEHYQRCDIYPEWATYWSPASLSIVDLYDYGICWYDALAQINRLLNLELFYQVFEHCKDEGFNIFQWVDDIAKLLADFTRIVLTWSFELDPFELAIPVYGLCNRTLATLVPYTAEGVTCLCADLGFAVRMASRVLDDQSVSCMAQQFINVIAEYYQSLVEFFFDFIALIRNVIYAGGTTTDISNILKGILPGDTVVAGLSANTALERFNAGGVYLYYFLNHVFAKAYCTGVAELNSEGDSNLEGPLYQACISDPANNPDLFCFVSTLISVLNRALRLSGTLLWHLPQIIEETATRPPGPRWLIDTWFLVDWAIVFDTIRPPPQTYDYTLSLNNPTALPLRPSAISWPNVVLYGPPVAPDCDLPNNSRFGVPCQQCPIVSNETAQVCLCRTAAAIDNLTISFIGSNIWGPSICCFAGNFLALAADMFNFLIGIVVHIFNYDRLPAFLADQNYYDIIFTDFAGDPYTMGGVLNCANQMVTQLDPKLAPLANLFTTIVKAISEGIRLGVVGGVRMANSVIGSLEPGFADYVCITDTNNCILVERCLQWLRRPRFDVFNFDPIYAYSPVDLAAPEAFADWACYWLNYQILVDFSSFPPGNAPDICCVPYFAFRSTVELVKAVAEVLIGAFESFRRLLQPGHPFSVIWIQWAACSDLAVCNNFGALISDFEDLANCPCAMILEIEQKVNPGEPFFHCVCQVMGPGAKMIAEILRSIATFFSVAWEVINCIDQNFPLPECSVGLATRMDAAFNYIYAATADVSATAGGFGCLFGLPWVGIKLDCLGTTYTWPPDYPPCNTSQNSFGPGQIPCTMSDRLTMLFYYTGQFTGAIFNFIVSRIQAVLDKGLLVLIPGHVTLETGPTGSCSATSDFLDKIGIALFGSGKLQASSTHTVTNYTINNSGFNDSNVLNNILVNFGYNNTTFYMEHPDAKSNPYPYITQILNYTPMSSSFVYSSVINFTNLTNVTDSTGLIQAVGIMINCLLGPPSMSCEGPQVFNYTDSSFSPACFGYLLVLGGNQFRTIFPLFVQVTDDLCIMMGDLIQGNVGSFTVDLIKFVIDFFDFVAAFLGSTVGFIAAMLALFDALAGYFLGALGEALWLFTSDFIVKTFPQFSFETVFEETAAYFGLKRGLFTPLNEAMIANMTDGTFCKEAMTELIHHDNLNLANQLIWNGCYYLAFMPIAIYNATDGELSLPNDFFYNLNTTLPILKAFLSMITDYWEFRSGYGGSNALTATVNVPQEILDYAKQQLNAQNLLNGMTPSTIRELSIVLQVPNLTMAELLDAVFWEFHSNQNYNTSFEYDNYTYASLGEDENYEKRVWIHYDGMGASSPERLQYLLEKRYFWDTNVIDVLDEMYPGWKAPFYSGQYASTFGGPPGFLADLQRSIYDNLASKTTYIQVDTESGSTLSKMARTKDKSNTPSSEEDSPYRDPRLQSPGYCSMANLGDRSHHLYGDFCRLDSVTSKLHKGFTIRVDRPKGGFGKGLEKRGLIGAYSSSKLAANLEHQKALENGEIPADSQFNPFYQTNVDIYTSLMGNVVLNITSIGRVLPVYNGKVIIDLQNTTFLDYMKLMNYNTSANMYIIQKFEENELTLLQTKWQKLHAKAQYAAEVMNNMTGAGAYGSLLSEDESSEDDDGNNRTKRSFLSWAQVSWSCESEMNNRKRYVSESRFDSIKRQLDTIRYLSDRFSELGRESLNDFREKRANVRESETRDGSKSGSKKRYSEILWDLGSRYRMLSRIADTYEYFKEISDTTRVKIESIVHFDDAASMWAGKSRSEDNLTSFLNASKRFDISELQSNKRVERARMNKRWEMEQKTDRRREIFPLRTYFYETVPNTIRHLLKVIISHSSKIGKVSGTIKEHVFYKENGRTVFLKEPRVRLRRSLDSDIIQGSPEFLLNENSHYPLFWTNDGALVEGFDPQSSRWKFSVDIEGDYNEFYYRGFNEGESCLAGSQEDTFWLFDSSKATSDGVIEGELLPEIPSGLLLLGHDVSEGESPSVFFIKGLACFRERPRNNDSRMQGEQEKRTAPDSSPTEGESWRERFIRMYVGPFLEKYDRYVEITGRVPFVGLPLAMYEKIRRLTPWARSPNGDDSDNNGNWKIPESVYERLGLKNMLSRNQDKRRSTWTDEEKEKRKNFPGILDICLPSLFNETTCDQCDSCVPNGILSAETCDFCYWCNNCTPGGPNGTYNCDSCDACRINGPFCLGSCTGCTNCTTQAECLDCKVVELLLGGAAEPVQFCIERNYLPTLNITLFEVISFPPNTTAPSLSAFGWNGFMMWLFDITLYGLDKVTGVDIVATMAAFWSQENTDPYKGYVGARFLLKQFRFLEFGSCQRDINLLCKFGLGLKTGLIVSSLIMVGILAFVFVFGGAILYVISAVLGVNVFVFLVCMTSWLYNPVCFGSPLISIQSLLSLVGVPYFAWKLLPFCAMGEIYDLINSTITPYANWIPAAFYVTSNGTLPTNCSQFIDPPNCTDFGFNGPASVIGYAIQRYTNGTGAQYWLVDYLNSTCLSHDECGLVLGIGLGFLLIVFMGTGVGLVLGLGLVLSVGLGLGLGLMLSGTCDGILSPIYATNFSVEIANETNVTDACFYFESPQLLTLTAFMIVGGIIAYLVITVLLAAALGCAQCQTGCDWLIVMFFPFSGYLRSENRQNQASSSGGGGGIGSDTGGGYYT